MRALKTATIVLISLMSACSSAQGATPTVFKPGVTIFAPTAAPAATTELAPVQSDAPATAEVAQPTEAPAVVSNDVPALAAGASPYTGLPVDAAVLTRKPVLYKVANTVEVRPQSGLNDADVVVEHLSEGSITRFTALYHSKLPKKVGSVRSCRLIDLELPVMFDAAIVCSGTSPGVKPLMRASYAHKNNLTMISDFGPYECGACPMFRTADRVPPHNLFGNPANALKELDKRGNNVPATFRSWAFSPQAGPEGKPTIGVDVGYKSGVVGWAYNPGAGVWSRSLGNQKSLDANTGAQITMANVIVVYANHVTTLIQEDSGGSKSIEIQVWGEGPVRVFRDGREYGGKWRRNAELGNFEFVDPSGKRIPLKPGNSWIQMVPLSDVAVSTR